MKTLTEQQAKDLKELETLVAECNELEATSNTLENLAMLIEKRGVLETNYWKRRQQILRLSLSISKEYFEAEKKLMKAAARIFPTALITSPVHIIRLCEKEFGVYLNVITPYCTIDTRTSCGGSASELLQKPEFTNL